MKVIIDIPDQLYETCKRLHIEGDARPSESAIANGVPDLTKSQAYDKGFITAMKLYLRPQGEWIKVKQDTSLGNFEVKNKVCDQCNHATKYEYPFCPWCGADMRGDDNGLSI